jgi:hypothetical protein
MAKPMSAELEKRIVAALADPDATASALAALLTTLEAAVTASEKLAAASYAAYLDPILTPSATEGRAACERTRFAADRLKSLLPKLQAVARTAESDEAAAIFRDRFEALTAERDALAQELRTTYPSAVTAIVNVLSRCAEFERRASELHASKPSGVKGLLLSPELVARGLESFDRDTVSVTRDLRLPDWRQSTKLAWPPRSPSAGVVLAESVIPAIDPRYSADWASAKAAEMAARRTEEQRNIEQEAEREAASRLAYETR